MASTKFNNPKLNTINEENKDIEWFNFLQYGIKPHISGPYFNNNEHYYD